MSPAAPGRGPHLLEAVVLLAVGAVPAVSVPVGHHRVMVAEPAIDDGMCGLHPMDKGRAESDQRPLPPAQGESREASGQRDRGPRTVDAGSWRGNNATVQGPGPVLPPGGPIRGLRLILGPSGKAPSPALRAAGDLPVPLAPVCPHKNPGPAAPSGLSLGSDRAQGWPCRGADSAQALGPPSKACGPPGLSQAAEMLLLWEMGDSRWKEPPVLHRRGPRRGKGGD